MNKIIFMFALLLSFNASASVPSYLLKIVEIATATGKVSAGSISRAVDDLASNITEVSAFRKQFIAYAKRDAYKTETLLASTYVPVGQTLANGKLRNFTAINFYMPEQVRTIEFAVGAIDESQIFAVLNRLQKSSSVAVRNSVSSLKVSGSITQSLQMQNSDYIMRVATFKIKTSEIDQVELALIIRELRDVLEELI